MRITEINFSVARTTPLFPITGNPDDQYANVKPYAACRVQFDINEHADPNTADGKKLLDKAYEAAREVCTVQLSQFSKELREQFKPKAKR